MAEPVGSIGPVRVGDMICLGHWHGENMTWRVLDVEPSRAILLTERAIECRRYHEEYGKTCWSDCDLRAWLNGEFLEGAFSPAERDLILKAHITNDPNPYFGTPGGPDTHDLVFCLSLDEARIYMEEMADRICIPTRYALEAGVWTGVTGGCDWWLRTPGGNATTAMVVDPEGAVATSGIGTECGMDKDGNLIPAETGVRPAVWVRMQEGA